jgi:putative ABC transport system permease protein
MSFLQAVWLAWDTIRVQKLKSFFTVIGVTIGVMFLIAVVSIVGGMSRYMEDDLVGKLIAVNSFSLRARPDFQVGDATQAQRNEWRRRPRILATDIPPVAASLAPGVLWAVESSDNLKVESPFGSPRRTQCSTVSQDWFTIKKMGVSQGRLMNAQEYSSGTPVAVIGQDVADHFFPNLNPIGRELRIQSIPYTVVGVADKQGSVFGQSLDKFVIAPERAPLNRWVNPHGVVDAMIVQGQDDVGMREAIEAARATMRARRHLHPSQHDNFELETSDTALEFWNKLKGYLVMAGIALPTVGLVVGAIVIMNIMLVAVAERTREIGIKRAIGGSRSRIVRELVIEAALIGFIGGAVGLILGAVVVLAVNEAGRASGTILFDLTAGTAIAAVAFSTVLGAIAGFVPALHAARLDPVRALRYE